MSGNLNRKCLLCCVSAITSSELSSLFELRQSSLLYKIIDSEKNNFEDFKKEIKGFFNDKLNCTLEDNEDGLLKIILLSIVVYILKSNDNNKQIKLTELCNKIPFDLHKNACSMFSPIIMRYSDSEDVTDLDLEQCLNGNDKENEMSFFSPIKVNEKSKQQHTFASHKQKIHQSIKASRNYEPFSTFVDDFDPNEIKESSFVKLVNYVQSPDYQTKKLMKSNRDLGKNVNDLQYKLYMTSNFEVELEKTLTRWKDKCKSLENKLKEVQNMLQTKEEEVKEKIFKIDELFDVVINNKRLEEKIKDYQEKIEEFQSISKHYDSALEENKKLTIENHNLGHYYSLAKQRRIEIENLLKEIEYERNKNLELHATNAKLSKAEDQLRELQNEINVLNKHNSIETQSETSFNTSFYSPEPMSIVVEKEKIDLLNELTQLKEVFVHKDIHESTVNNLNNELCDVKKELIGTVDQITNMTTIMDDLTMFCDYVKENKPWNKKSIGIVCKVKELFDENFLNSFNLNKNIAQLSSENNNLLQSRKDKEELILILNCQMKDLETKLISFEKGCKIIFDSLNIGNFNIEDFVNVIGRELTTRNENLCLYESNLKNYKQKLQNIRNYLPILFQNLSILKKDIQQNKIDNYVFLNEASKEISLFRENLNLEELNKKYEKIMSDSISLVKVNKENETTIKSLEKKLEENEFYYKNKLTILKTNEGKKYKLEIDRLRNYLEKEYNGKQQLLVDKHIEEEKESKCDMMKLIDNYQNCLLQINKMSLENEENIKFKDDIILKEINKYDKVLQQIKEKEEEIKNTKQLLEEKISFIIKLEMDFELQKQLSEEKSRRQKENIIELENKITEMKLNDEVLFTNLTDFELFKVRYDDLQNLYEDSQVKVQEIQTEIEYLKVNNETELKTFAEKIVEKENNLILLQTEFVAYERKIEKLLADKLISEGELKKLKEKEMNYIKDISVKDAIISTQQIKLDNQNKTIDNLKFKYSKTNLENEKFNVKIDELQKEILIKNSEIETMQLKISSLEDEVKDVHLLLNDSLNKVLLLEFDIGLKDNKIKDLESSVKSNITEICLLKSNLQERDNVIMVQEKDIGLKTCHITSIEEENERSVNRISEMNNLINELEEMSREKNIKITSITSEKESLKDALKECVQEKIQLQERVNVLLKDEHIKDQEIKNAETSISKFNLLIQNLELTIENEMHNFERINCEYKHSEEQSITYKNKYNILVQERKDEFNECQETIDRLTLRVHTIEEERDDEIHKMEKLFNAEIFELQQRFEYNTVELNSVKDENINSRKTHKTIRKNLEEEIDRLQKALQSRENQFHDEKVTLKSVIEKDRDDKLKYKEGYEQEIDRLENQIKCAEEKYALELSEIYTKSDVFEGKVNELQLFNSRQKREIKENETKYQEEISSLNSRIVQLEPLEEEIVELEEKTRQLMSKLTQLENGETLKELKQLREQNISQSDHVILLEKSIDNFKHEKESMEQNIKAVMYSCEKLTNEKKKLNEVINDLKEQLQSSESKSKSRLLKIDNYEREIKSLTCDNETLKKRYLMLREINEKHKLEVESDHQNAVDNYIARLEALTKDVANFQEQMQLLTKENNFLLEKNYSSKRTIDEQSAKLDGLQKLIWNHTENDRKQLLTTYDENSRYTRMSHWTDIPQTSRQLPPVSRLDPQISDSIGLNVHSRARFESFIYSPYTCEDECSLAMIKELPLPPLPPRKQTSTISDVYSTPILTPTRSKKKKEGIRLQISNKFRRSLNLDPATPKPQKIEESVIPKSEMSTAAKVSSTSSSKPPLPKKNLFSSIKSHLMGDQIEIKDKKRDRATAADYGHKSMNPSTTSEYSLFTQDCEPDTSEAKFSNSKISPSESGESHFSQSAKTPKPHSVIKNLIRRSKNLSPKRKHPSSESL